MASDKTNLAFLIQVVQVGGCNGKKDSEAASTSTLGWQTTFSCTDQSCKNHYFHVECKDRRGKEKTKDQRTEEYKKVPYNNAIKKLKKAQESEKKERPNAALNPISAQLTKRRECAAVLTTTKVDTMRRDVMTKISDGVYLISNSGKL